MLHGWVPSGVTSYAGYFYISPQVPEALLEFLNPFIACPSDGVIPVGPAGRSRLLPATPARGWPPPAVHPPSAAPHRQHCVSQISDIVFCVFRIAF